MKERPILFSGPMVRAILEGRKSQTRRLMKPQPGEWWKPEFYAELHKMKDGEFVMRRGEPVVLGWGACNEEGDEGYKCPYGEPGDRLWVREAFAKLISYEGNRERFIYKEDCQGVPKWEDASFRPSIHMPRVASRITLEVPAIRVERLNDISEDDAIAEGVNGEPGTTNHFQDYLSKDQDIAAQTLMCHSAVDSFMTLWESIHGLGSWELNPWVWVVSVEKVTL